MIDFSFERDGGDDVSGLDMGHMLIRQGDVVITSRGKSPSQKMMIFIAVADLLDGVAAVCSGKERKYEFVGADSSFVIFFESSKCGRILICSEGVKIGPVGKADLCKSLASSVERFLGELNGKFVYQGAVIEDLKSSLKRFVSVS